MTNTTIEDVINAAASIATDAAEGRLDPAQLERHAVKELSALMLIEPDAGSDLEALQAESARRVLARGGIATNELAEWLAVQRRRENPDADAAVEAVDAAAAETQAEGPAVPTDADSSALEAHSPGSDADDGDYDPEPADVADPEPEPVTETGCKCAAPVLRGPKFGGTVLAVGRGVPTDPGLRPL